MMISRQLLQSLSTSFLSSLIVAGTVIGMPLRSPAQSSDTLFAADNNTPLTLTLGDLDSSWKKIRIAGQYEMADIMKSWSSFFGTEIYSNIYYTQGKTTKIGDRLYLVAYRIPTDDNPLNIMALFSMGNNQCSESLFPGLLTPKTTVSLALLNFDTIGSLNDIVPLDIKTDIANSKTRYDEAKNTCNKLKLDTAKQQAIQWISSVARAEQAHYLETETFTESIDDLGLEMPEDSEHYRYSLMLKDKVVYLTSQAVNNDLPHYVGAVYTSDDGQGNVMAQSLICEANKPGGSLPKWPTKQNDLLSCPTGTHAYP